MSGSAGVMALLLSETMAGSLVFLFCAPLWNEVKRGYFKLVGIVAVVVGLSATGSIAVALVSGSGAGRASLEVCEALTATTVLWVVLLFARKEKAARIVGLASVAVSVVLLVELVGTAGGSHAVALLKLIVGAAFLGAVLDGLLLGHWYLTDRGLTRKPINRATLILIVSVALKAVAVLAGGFGPTEGAASFNPLLTSAGLSSWIALGMVAATATIAVLIKLTLKGERATAVQAATGFFYLAVLTAFTAELATLVGFLPG